MDQDEPGQKTKIGVEGTQIDVEASTGGDRHIANENEAQHEF